MNITTEDFESLIREINDLKTRVEKLENENVNLKKNIILNNPNKNNRISLHLNKRSIPDVTYNEWIDYLIQNVEFKLDLVFENDLMTGIESLFKDSIDNFDKLPIIAFNRKPNIFYYFNDSGEWVILENKDFDKILGRLDYWFIYQFNRCWYQVNSENVKNLTEYKDKYDNYYLKILGGNRITTEVRFQKIRHNFYKMIKENL